MASFYNDKMSEEEIAERALALMREGSRGREQAARLLEQRLRGRMQAYLVRHRVPDADAEELVIDVWLKLLRSEFDQRTRPVVWLWKVARSVLLDWIRRRRSEKRGSGTVEMTLDEDQWLELQETVGAAPAPPWLKLCLERAMFQLEQDDPARAEVLRLAAEGWTAREIAIYYGAESSAVTQKQEGAARDRVYQARKKAQSYFQHCKE